MSKFLKRLQIVFIILFILTLLSGFVLYVFGYKPLIKLNGAFLSETLDVPSDKDEFLKEIGNGQLFSSVEAVYNQDYPFRPFSIKLNNSIDFLQGKSSNTSVCIGKNHELYEYPYIWDYEISEKKWNGKENEDNLKEIARKLAYIQDEFRNYDKYIYVLITPNKAEFSDQNIPLSMKTHDDSYDGPKIRNIDILKQYFDEYEISYFDCTDYIKNDLPSNVIPFYRSGIHYSWAAGYYTARELFKRVEDETGLFMPDFDLHVEETDDIIFPNRDLFNLLNTFSVLTDNVYSDLPQQRVYVENIEKSPVSMVLQGGSFLGSYIDMNSRYPEMFRNVDIIQNKTFLPSSGGSISLDTIQDVDLKMIQNDQLFVFEVNETSANAMSFGFIDYLTEYLENQQIDFIEPRELILSSKDSIFAAQPYGIYDLEAYDLAWRHTAKEFGCVLKNEQIFKNGLVLKYSVVEALRASSVNGEVFVNVTINDIVIGDYRIDETGSLFISPELLANAQRYGDICQIDCSVDCSYIPHEMNPDNIDTRELSLILFSITAGSEEVD